MAKLKGKKVRKAIVRFYTHKKHYSPKRADYIAGAVAYAEHEERTYRKHKKSKKFKLPRHYRRR